MTQEFRFRVVTFAPATPGWRMWLVDSSGEPEEVALAGWVTLAEVEIMSHDWDSETERTTGHREIRPGWFSDWEVTTTADPFQSGRDTYVIGPGDHVPTPEEVAEWGKKHREFRERLKQPQGQA